MNLNDVVSLGAESSFSSGRTFHDDGNGMTVVGASVGHSFDCGNTGTDVGRTAWFSQHAD